MNDTLSGGTASRQGVPAVVAKTELDSDLLYNTSDKVALYKKKLTPADTAIAGCPASFRL